MIRRSDNGNVARPERNRRVGVPPPDSFAPQCYAREQAGSGFPLYSSLVPRCGVPLQSVTRLSLLALMLLAFRPGVTGQSKIEGHYVFAPGMGGTELYLHGDGTYRCYAYGCMEQYSDTGTYSLHQDTLLLKSLFADPSRRNATLSLKEGASTLPAIDDTILVALQNRSPQAAYDLKLTCSVMTVEEIDSFPKAMTQYYRIPAAMLNGDSTMTLEMGKDRLVVNHKPVVVFEIHGESKLQNEPLDRSFIWRGTELCMIVSADFLPVCLKRQ